MFEFSVMNNVLENQLLYTANLKLGNLVAIKSHSAAINDSTRINRIKGKNEAATFHVNQCNHLS